MKHEILSSNALTLLYSLRMFLINKKLRSQRKDIVQNLSKNKKIENTRKYLNETMFENQEQQKRIFRTSVNYLIPALTWNE